MAYTPITASLTVPPLTDNTVWFANAAAWNAYWQNGAFQANIPIAGQGVYGVVQQATTQVFVLPNNIVSAYTILQVDLTGNGILTAVPVAQQPVVDALVANLNALIADYGVLKLALKNAGLISAN
jgi:hypothetical protein